MATNALGVLSPHVVSVCNSRVGMCLVLAVSFEGILALNFFRGIVARLDGELRAVCILPSFHQPTTINVFATSPQFSNAMREEMWNAASFANAKSSGISTVICRRRLSSVQCLTNCSNRLRCNARFSLCAASFFHASHQTSERNCVRNYTASCVYHLQPHNFRNFSNRSCSFYLLLSSPNTLFTHTTVPTKQTKI